LDSGILNIKGAYYAKCINLSREEPEIYDVIRFGLILKNVMYDTQSYLPNYDDTGITENTTHCAYPIEYIPNAKILCIVERQSSNIIMLMRDAFAIFPPISKISLEQASYHFPTGYTS